MRLPSGAPLTTPAVYRGRVYVSGGFRSKELYALDARTGQGAWGLDLDDDGPSAPACAEGVCAINTESCTLFVVDAATGAPRWSWWLGDPLTSAPAIADGRVFASYPVSGLGSPQQAASANATANANANPAPPGAFHPAPSPVAGDAAPGASPLPASPSQRRRPPGMTHALAAFDLATGRILWQVWLDSDVLSAPAVYGAHVYATSFAGTLYELEAATGRVVSARRVRATSAPVVDAGGRLHLTQRVDRPGEAAAEAVVAGPSAGAPAWVSPSKAAPYLDAAVQASSGLASQAAGNDAANGFAGGAPAAANPGAALNNIGQGNVFSMQAFQGSRVLATQAGLVNTMGDEVRCADTHTGAPRWSLRLEGDLRRVGGFLAAPPALAGGRLIIATHAGEVLEVEPTSGKVLRRHAVGHPVRSQPVIDAGWIYVGTDDGYLVGIDTGDPTLTGWAQWGGDAARTGRPAP